MRRLKAAVLLDGASLYTNSAYADLNPVRSTLAQTLESSAFSGAKDRIDDLAERTEPPAKQVIQSTKNQTLFDLFAA